MLKLFLLGVFLCCEFYSFADCFDVLDPNNTLRTSSTITLDDAKRSCNYILKNVRFDSESDDDDCLKSTDEKCIRIASKIAAYYFKDHYKNHVTKFLFSNEDIYFLFLAHTFSENTDLTPTPNNYKSFLNYMLSLFDASNTEQLLKNKDFVANRSGLHLARIKQWKAAGKLDSIANVYYQYSFQSTNYTNKITYRDSIYVSYEYESAPILDVQITEKEFKTITEELRLKLLKCDAYSGFCNKKGIKNSDVSLAENYLAKWKKILTDRFGEIKLKGEKDSDIYKRIITYSLAECGNEIDFNDYYNIIEDIVIDNRQKDAFKDYVKMYKENTLYDHLRNEYLNRLSTKK